MRIVVAALLASIPLTGCMSTYFAQSAPADACTLVGLALVPTADESPGKALVIYDVAPDVTTETSGALTSPSGEGGALDLRPCMHQAGWPGERIRFTSAEAHAPFMSDCSGSWISRPVVSGGAAKVYVLACDHGAAPREIRIAQLRRDPSGAWKFTGWGAVVRSG